MDENNNRMSPELKLVSNYLLQEMRKKKHVTSITPPQTRNMISPQQMSMGDKSNVTITPPSNGVQYCKSEVVNELRKYEKGSKEIGTASDDASARYHMVQSGSAIWTDRYLISPISCARTSSYHFVIPPQ